MKFYFSGDYSSRYSVFTKKYSTREGRIKVGDQILVAKDIFPSGTDIKEQKEYIYEEWAKAKDNKGEYAVIFKIGFKYDEQGNIREIWRSSEAE